MSDLGKRRHQMVSRQIKARGVRDKRVLNALRKVHREAFVPQLLSEHAYDDAPLPIAAGQTISQPFIVGYMIEALALSGGETVLEIGAGSGYASAVLAQIAAKVFAIERIEELATSAASQLAKQGYDNVRVIHADGTKGLRDEAPFDAILVSAGATQLPEALRNQLAVGGRMVVPIGPSETGQELIRITRLDNCEFDRETLGDVRFVPLISDERC